MYTQSDLNFKQSMKLGESKTVAFDATFTNVLNQHAAVSFGQQIDSGYTVNFISPQTAGCNKFNQANYGFSSTSCFLPDGPAFYAGAMNPYPYATLLNSSPLGSYAGGPVTVDSQYNKPYLYQLARNIRLAVHFTF
jgi:hypothetical protein